MVVNTKWLPKPSVLASHELLSSSSANCTNATVMNKQFLDCYTFKMVNCWVNVMHRPNASMPESDPFANTGTIDDSSY